MNEIIENVLVLYSPLSFPSLRQSLLWLSFKYLTEQVLVKCII